MKQFAFTQITASPGLKVFLQLVSRFIYIINSHLFVERLFIENLAFNF